MKWPWSESIAQRILWGYYVLVALVAVTMVLMWASLVRVRSQIYVLEASSELMDTVLEVRRYEKNWLLYRETFDFENNEKMVAAAIVLLDQRRQDFTAKGPVDAVSRMRSGLVDYRSLMHQEVRVLGTDQQQRLEEELRAQGKKLVEQAEVLNRRIRDSIDRTLELVSVFGMLFVLFVAVLAVFIGQKMATSVVQPLQQLVSYTRQIVADQTAVWTSSIKAVEVNAVVDALTGMMAILRRQEQQIIQREKLAAVGTLVAGVAHELNNPISNAGSSAQILLEELQEAKEGGEFDRAFFRDMVVQIVEQADRARGIVRALLEFSREREVRPTQLRVSEFVLQTSRLVRGEIPSNVILKVVIGKDGLFWADKQKLQQALVNLLLNAVQAVGEKGKILLHSWLDEEDENIFFEVKDNGPGIPDAVLEKIFDPFFTTKDVGEGAGLGLAVTREIIGKHGGTIRVDTEDGYGSRFVIKLPVKLSEQMLGGLEEGAGSAGGGIGAPTGTG
ncbi:MAG: ATP-binding protein [Desulfobulbaceae bacterium]|nr:ATP-binding protein [Desulfobulbaceae bacterium]